MNKKLFKDSCIYYSYSVLGHLNVKWSKNRVEGTTRAKDIIPNSRHYTAIEKFDPWSHVRVNGTALNGILRTAWDLPKDLHTA